MKQYKKGVYNGEGCKSSKPVNHAALLVGYNLEAAVPYFILKNAWGPEWGMGGYYRIAIGELNNTNMGLCQLAGTEYNVIPIF